MQDCRIRGEPWPFRGQCQNSLATKQCNASATANEVRLISGSRAAGSAAPFRTLFLKVQGTHNLLSDRTHKRKREMYIYIYIYIHTHTCVRIYIYIYTHTYVYTYTYIYICMYTYVYIYIHVSIQQFHAVIGKTALLWRLLASHSVA